MKTIATPAVAALLGAALGVSACAAPADIAAYAPAVDIKGQGISEEKWLEDLSDCREIGEKVQEQYLAQQEEEAGQAIFLGVLGLAAGVAAGQAIGNNRAYEGALTTQLGVAGAGAGLAVGASQADYMGVVARRGPQGVVDECLAGRGYRILSGKSLGGG